MLAINIFFWKYLFYLFILTSTKYWLPLTLITRKAVHVKFISKLHDSMNWKNCRSFWSLQIWSKNNNLILPRTGIVTSSFCVYYTTWLSLLLRQDYFHVLFYVVLHAASGLKVAAIVGLLLSNKKEEKNQKFIDCALSMKLRAA